MNKNNNTINNNFEKLRLEDDGLIINDNIVSIIRHQTNNELKYLDDELKNDELKNLKQKGDLFYSNYHNISNLFNNCSFQLTIFCIFNFYNLFKKYGFYSPTNNDKEAVYLDHMGIGFTRKINIEAIKQLNIEKLIDALYKTYLEKSLAPNNLFYCLLKDNLIIDLDIDNILNNNPYITLDDIYTLCLYTNDLSLFNKYISLLNNCPKNLKNIILEYIKPVSFYIHIPNSARFSILLEFFDYFRIRNNKIKEKLNIPNIDIKQLLESMWILDTTPYDWIYFVYKWENYFMNDFTFINKLLSSNRTNNLYELIELKELIINNYPPFFKLDFEINKTVPVLKTNYYSPFEQLMTGCPSSESYYTVKHEYSRFNTCHIPDINMKFLEKIFENYKTICLEYNDEIVQKLLNNINTSNINKELYLKLKEIQPDMMEEINQKLCKDVLRKEICKLLNIKNTKEYQKLKIKEKDK